MPIIPNDTLSSVLNLVNRRANPDLVIQPPPALSHTGFTLDASGVAGFFGGNSAIRAMATVNLVSQRRRFGWYNAAGAYEVAKQYSVIANSRIFTALFPTGDSDPAKILTVVDRQVDPKFTPLYSLTGKAPSSIGPLGSLVARKVSQIPIKKARLLPKENTMHTCRVTFVKLSKILTDELNELQLVPSSPIILGGVCTILISIGGCIVCALFADWFCFASIALGIIANGVACLVVGSGKLYLRHNPPAPSQADTPGDVLLRITDTDIIVLIGNEGMARPFTHGQFSLCFGDTPSPDHTQSSGNHWRDEVGAENSMVNPRTDVVPWSQTLQKYLIHISVILLLFQFLAQLLLIPQGTLLGQLIFIGTLGSSWMYQLYLSALRLDLQTQALFETLSIRETDDIYQYQLNTWTQAAVFTCLVFRSIHKPVWHSSNSNTYEQRRDDEIALEAVNKRKKQLENKEGEAKLKWEKYIKAAQEVEEAGRVQETADAEVEEAQKAVEEAQKEVEEAEAEMKEAQQVQVQKQIEEVQEKKAAAEALVTDKKEEAKKCKEKVKRCKEEVEKRKSEVKKKQEQATEKAKEKAMKDTQAKKAKEAADKQKKAVADMKLKNRLEEEDEAKRKQDYDKIVHQKKKEDQALQALLDALLPGQTDVWRAFKESLMRKLSKPKTTSTWAYMGSDGTLEFNDGDTFAGGEGSISTELTEMELEQLHTYQSDAKSAFTAWRAVNIGKITQ